MLYFKKIIFIITYHYFHNKCFLLMIPERSRDIEYKVMTAESSALPFC